MGTSLPLPNLFLVGRDHPHAYGDKFPIGSMDFLPQGSSPRVWGQDSQSHKAERKARIIPTRMGTSSSFSEIYFSFQDHPHAYGDKSVAFLLVTQYKGSSPRVWGQVTKKITVLAFMRIIPTRMGTRGYGFCVVSETEDHPHAYGDKYHYSKK